MPQQQATLVFAGDAMMHQGQLDAAYRTGGDYDFSDDMRKAQFGLMAGADWAFLGHLGAYLDLSWGLTGVFHSNFKTIEQAMYPIYGTVGLFYRFN